MQFDIEVFCRGTFNVMARPASIFAAFILLTLNYAACQSPGSTVAPQSPAIPADSIPYLLAETEAQQRQLFPTSDFTFAFDTPDTSTPGGNLSGLVGAVCKGINI